MGIKAVFPSKDLEVLGFGVLALGFHIGPVVVGGLFMLVKTSRMRHELNGRKLDDEITEQTLESLVRRMM